MGVASIGQIRHDFSMFRFFIILIFVGTSTLLFAKVRPAKKSESIILKPLTPDSFEFTKRKDINNWKPVNIKQVDKINFSKSAVQKRQRSTIGKFHRVIWHDNPIIEIINKKGKKEKYWCYKDCDQFIYSYDTKKFLGKTIRIDWQKNVVSSKSTKSRLVKKETTRVVFLNSKN